MIYLPYVKGDLSMLQYIWPIVVVVAANTFYNICAKSVPENVNSFAALTVTYTIAAVVSLVLFFVTGEQKNFITEIMKLNWTSVVLGIAIVALEFGYIAIYRAGWKITTASLVANISLAVVLLIVGVLVYKEQITLKQIIGVIVCAAGLVLVTNK